MSVSRTTFDAKFYAVAKDKGIKVRVVHQSRSGMVYYYATGDNGHKVSFMTIDDGDRPDLPHWTPEVLLEDLIELIHGIPS